MRIVFRVDSGLNIGSGHLMRCLTLANGLRSLGADIAFITRENPGHYIYKLEEAAYIVHRLPAPLSSMSASSNGCTDLDGVTTARDVAESMAFIRENSWDLLVVDHYGLGIYWERCLRPYVNRILVIDDLANREHDCDILVDQNYFGIDTLFRYKNRVSEACRCLLGPQYALLQPAYTQLRNILPQHRGRIGRVLVFFGASDPDDQTGKVLAALDYPELAHLAVDIVVGANYPNLIGLTAKIKKRDSTTLYNSLPSLAALMLRADLFIGAGGSTTWERMALGLPALVISIAENQREMTRALAIDRYQSELNHKNISLSEWRRNILKLIQQPKLVTELFLNARSLVDGLGVNRLVQVLLINKKFELVLRRANRDDEAMLLSWVNEDGVRKQSFQQNLISAREHSKWLATKLKDPNCIILIGVDKSGLPIGQVRFEIQPKQDEVSVNISIDRSLRGMGYSEQLLGQAIKYWKSIQPTLKLIAEIRIENQASQKLFVKCKFVQIPFRRAGSYTFELIP